MTRDRDPKKKPDGTPVLDEERAVGLPPAEPVTALRVVGRDLELRLSPEKRSFTLGSAAQPEVDLTVTSAGAPQHVSGFHALVQRKGNRLWVLDQRSTNGIFLRDRREAEFEVVAGDAFRIAEVRLLALDEHLGLLRPQLQWALGLDAYARVDAALELVAAGMPVLLAGKPGCDQAALARAIHDTSARRYGAFMTVADRGATLGDGAKGTAFVDLHRVAGTKPLPPGLLAEVFDRPSIRTIVSAASLDRAHDLLGVGHAARCRSSRSRRWRSVGATSRGCSTRCSFASTACARSPSSATRASPASGRMTGPATSTTSAGT